jgi:acyl-CoA thioesterase FadM
LSLTDLLAALRTGTPVLHSRAEAWECDFNNHWNTRYYCRAFQMAGEVAAMRAGQVRADITGWHVRFHAELVAGDPIVVRGFETGEGAAFIMTRDDRIVATALATGPFPQTHLPALPDVLVAQVSPRGVTGPVMTPWPMEKDTIYELGPVGAGDLLASGDLAYWRAAARLSHCTHHYDTALGFTPEMMKTQNLGRMLAELRFTSLGPVKGDDFLRAAARMTAAKGKAFQTAHFLHTHRGTPVAMFELCTLAVDLQARRAIPLPDFVTARLS